MARGELIIRCVIVTIDGPAGAGKSTAARMLAARLNIRFLDTGAMYRAFTFKALREGIDVARPSDLVRMIRASRLEMPPHRVLLDGQDVTDRIRTPEISDKASILSTHPEVRVELVRLQQEIGRHESLVTEGRDQGTVAFPDAEFKFYLTADPQERARRRRKDLGECAPVEEILEEIRRRDERDMSRTASPLRPPDGAIVIDTTTLSAEQVVDLMLKRMGYTKTA
jgi:cytidylate kinase